MTGVPYFLKTCIKNDGHVKTIVKIERNSKRSLISVYLTYVHKFVWIYELLVTFQLKERSGSMENESDSNSTITPRTVVSAVPLHPPKQDSASTSDSDWPSASPPTPSPSRSRALSQRGSLRGAKPTTPVSVSYSYFSLILEGIP